MTGKTQCSARVWRSRGIMGESWRCRMPEPFVEREGKLFCHVHDPVAVAAKRKARQTAWTKKWAEKDAAEALRQQHERIGRLVCENAGQLDAIIRTSEEGHLSGAGLAALAAILKELES